MTTITKYHPGERFPVTWSGMTALGWFTGSLLYLLTLLATAYFSSAFLSLPFGRADVIIARELISFLLFGATIGLSQAVVLARWNAPPWPPFVGWSLGLPLGWLLGVELQANWGLMSVSPGSLFSNLAGYGLITAFGVGLSTFAWALSGSSVGIRWAATRVLGSVAAFAAIAPIAYAIAKVEIPSYPFGILELLGFPLLVGLAALIGEGIGSRILDRELFG